MIRNSVIAAIEDDYEQHLQLIEQFRGELATLPIGTLHSRVNKGKTRYYHYIPSPAPGVPAREVYINKSQEHLVEALARRKFIEKSLRLLEKNIKILKALLNEYTTYDPEAIILELPKPYKGTNCSTAFGLLEARNPSKWASEPYEKNPINPEGLTCRSEYGLSVRSKSESIIASQLERYNIPFRYEALLQLEGQIYYPDFTILNPQDNQVIYWEHFGMVDDPEYARQMDNKLTEYRKRGILQGKNLITTYETRAHPLSAQNVRRIIKAFLLPDGNQVA
ncbi:MAG: hypothetical protein QM289_03080 [Bacillota bacterium]|jgi:hypothetical protein|nr:hypothetical protein [Bacillota bacterium]NLM08736.1 hypothetical protein [Clostridiales Family XIII bacterium]